MVDRVTLMKFEMLIILVILANAVFTLRIRRSSFQNDVELFLRERQAQGLNG